MTTLLDRPQTIVEANIAPNGDREDRIFRNLIRSVKMKFFKDDATGAWGLTHKDTLVSDGFNAFWGGKEIFHDVFEHAHEGTVFFRGEAFLNVGGEMAAMGAMYYFVQNLGIRERLMNPNSFWQPEESMVQETLQYYHSAYSDGDIRFGDELVSHVPKQKAVNRGYYSGIESFLDEYAYALAGARRGKSYGPISQHRFKKTKEYVEQASKYTKSFTMKKVRDLHRWGWLEAEKLVPDEHENKDMLKEFIEKLEHYTKMHSAEDEAMIHPTATARIFQTEEGIISWEVEFEPDRYDDEGQSEFVRSSNFKI